MGLFTTGSATQTTNKTLAPAEIASRLFAIKLLLSRLAQTGGAPQTLGEYIKSGPRKFDPRTISDASNAYMAALNQPGAFSGSGSTTKYKGASPSTFQDLASGLVTALLLKNVLMGGKAGSSGGGLLGGILGGGGGLSSTAGGMSTGNNILDSLITQNYGDTYLPTSSGGGYSPMVPGGDVSNVPSDYPGLSDGSWFSWLG